MRHTVSSIRAWRTCKRKYKIQHVERFRPARVTSALGLGTAVHLGLEQFLAGKSAVEALDAVTGCELSGSDRAKSRAMLLAYYARWGAGRSEWDVVEVEGTFEYLLGGAAMLCGKRDAVMRHRPTGALYLVEHKTTSEDASEVGSDYWQRLAVDLQLTTYQATARAKYGEDLGLLYDVLRKPSVRLKKDESPEVYEARCYEQMMAEPEAWLVRREVHRLAEQSAATLAELREDIEAIEAYASRKSSLWPRNDSACSAYNSTCSFLGVCAGVEQLDSERFVRLETSHPELSAQQKIGAFDDCPL